MQVAFLRIKNIVRIKSYATLKSSKFATPPKIIHFYKEQMRSVRSDLVSVMSKALYYAKQSAQFMF